MKSYTEYLVFETRKRKEIMAITYTSTTQHAQHRECITFSDGFGAVMKLYVHAREQANRAALIAQHTALMEGNEASIDRVRSCIEYRVWHRHHAA
jgi:hypothetical protein